MLKPSDTPTAGKFASVGINSHLVEEQQWSFGPLSISEAAFAELTERARSMGLSPETMAERILESLLGPGQEKVRYTIEEAKDKFKLTDREAETLTLAKQGQVVKEIAVSMGGISPGTVKAFLRLVHTKMGCTSRKEALGLLLPLM